MNTRQVIKARGYATQKNALKKLNDVIELSGIDYDIDYFIAVNDEGRYVPVVWVQQVAHNAFFFASKGVTVIG